MKNKGNETETVAAALIYSTATEKVNSMRYEAVVGQPEKYKRRRAKAIRR
jgi:hypothetical protein